jgi:AraC-like DNA-binding protein/quercetin dioxygenase-like cupin family protein
MDKSAQNPKELSKTAIKPSIRHAAISELFEDEFPLYLNRWEEGFELRKHDHAFLEIVYVMAGEGYHYVGERVEKTEKGCLYVLPLGTSHVFRPSGASVRSSLLVYNLCIRPEFVSELKIWLSRIGGSVVPFTIFDGPSGTYIALIDKSMELANRFEQLHREFTDRRPGFETSMIGGLMQLAARISRMLEKEATPEEGAQASRRRGTKISNIMEYIQLHFTERLTIEQLSSSFGISRRHFIRLFRQSTGMGFSDYIQLRRIEYACRLLLETDDKIAYIARCTGYNDSAHFSEVFQKLIGTSPSSYRKSNLL